MLLASSALAWERGRLGAAMFRRRRQAPFEQHVPLAQELQLPALGRGRAGIQRRHLDAAHRAGLAGADRAHRPQRDGRGNGDGAAVRAALAAVAAEDRKSVVWGKSGAVGVDLGGPGTSKKKKR